MFAQVSYSLSAGSGGLSRNLAELDLEANRRKGLTISNYRNPNRATISSSS